MKPRARSASAHPIRPLRSALLLAGLYVLLCSLYILVSSAWAAQLAGSVLELHHFEQWKGLVFVASTGSLFFLLARSMLERTARQSRQLQRQETLLEEVDGAAIAGTFSAAIAQDIDSALGVARAGLEGVALEGLEARERASSLLWRALEDLGRISERMARLGEHHDRAVLALDDLSEIVRESVHFGQRHESLLRCRIEVDAPPTMPAEVDRGQIQRALLHLLLNAAEATEHKGRIRVMLRRDVSEFRRAVIEVHDDGRGIPEEEREAIFSVFHGSQEDKAGIGLFAVRSAAEAHDGEAIVTDSELGGACFRMRFRITSKRSD